MRHRIGIKGTALSWFKSYFTNRSQRVCINDSISETVTLDYGLPQRSVIGPGGFSIYMLPLGDIIRKHGLNYHCYADDTQVYLSVNPVQQNVAAAVHRMKTCFDEIRLWMSQNHLKLNDDKTEFIIIGSNPQRAKVFVPHIRVGDANIVPSTSVRNLGVIFDSSMSMDDHISKAAKSAHISLRNIGRVRKHLNKDTSELLVHAFVSSRLDMGNSLLYGVTNLQLSQLQCIQNMAARIVTLTKTREHITPVLFDLHWLPVRQRTMYKLGLLCTRSLVIWPPVT